MRLLVVEDDQELAEGLVSSLQQSAYVVDLCTTGEAALAATATTAYDAVLLDLGLPDMDGIELLKQLRNRGKAPPVIILTARDPLTDRVKGLDAGADDYLVKPIALPELEARLRAVLRRAGGGDTAARFGNVELDAGQLHATADGKPLDLTAREFAALRALMRRQGRIVAKEQMFESMYDAESETNPNAIEVHVSRLRKKLEGAGADVGIRALRGLGYRLERWTP